MRKVIYSILFAIIFLAINVEAQQNASIKVQARNCLDSVILRWAPDKASAWKLLNTHGYVVERRTVYKANEFIHDKPIVKTLVTEAIRPYSEKEFETMGDTSTYMLLVYQALYGESFELNSDAGQLKGPLALINKAKELDNRFSFSMFAADMDAKAAKSLGLLFTDTGIRPGERYIYRVYSAVPKHISPIDSGFVYVNLSDTFKLPKPLDFNVEAKKNAALLTWNKEFHNTIYINYSIERSVDGGASFQVLNPLPEINPYHSIEQRPDINFYIDNLPEQIAKCHYRIRGISLFGEFGPYSDTLSANFVETGEFLNPEIEKYDVSLDNKVILKWKMTHKDSIFVAGFDVLRANNIDGPFLKLNPHILQVNTRLFIDSFPNPVNYYIVRAYDTQNNSFPSYTSMVQLIDSVPPSAPDGLIGTIDSSGIVYLSWEENTEPDLLSYRIFKANHPQAEFVKVNQTLLVQNSFRDSILLKTLSPYIYYKITALDQRYNQSEYSKILKLKKPDIVPPAGPVFSKYEVSDSAINIHYISSPSEDVYAHNLYRLANGVQTLIFVIKDSIREGIVYDKEFVPNVINKYQLQAVDSSGLVSEMAEINIKAPSSVNNEIQNFNVFVNFEMKGVELSWSYNSPEISNFLIYRANNEEPISRYMFVNSASKSFLDKNVKKNGMYGYRVQAILKSGKRSKISPLKTISY